MVLFTYSEREAEETIPASLVISSQIPGYDGEEVDTTERVELTFPLLVRNCVYMHAFFL